MASPDPQSCFRILVERWEERHNGSTHGRFDALTLLHIQYTQRLDEFLTFELSL